MHSNGCHFPPLIVLWNIIQRKLAIQAWLFEFFLSSIMWSKGYSFILLYSMKSETEYEQVIKLTLFILYEKTSDWPKWNSPGWAGNPLKFLSDLSSWIRSGVALYWTDIYIKGQVYGWVCGWNVNSKRKADTVSMLADFVWRLNLPGSSSAYRLSSWIQKKKNI